MNILKADLVSKKSVLDLYLPLKRKSDLARKKKKVIVLAGPTAVGKTEISISIAQILDGEIISADSMQVYKGMDIGTAKADKEQLKKIKHHLIDIKEVSDIYNVADYYSDAHAACRKILFKGMVPIIVGGSGFYIHSFLYGSPLGPPSDPEVRGKIEKKLSELGIDVFYERLQILDPQYAKTISHKDKHKIIRAFEIMTISKKKVSDIPKPRMDENFLYNYRLWFIYMPKDILYKRIDERCDQMIKLGFIDEVKKLKLSGLENNSSAAGAIGYRQCLDYLSTNQTKSDFENFITQFKKATKKYVKRQLTWFKKEPHFRWINIEELGKERVKEFILQDYEQSM